MFALSVSISTSSSPTATSSPTDFIQPRTVPSSIESERRGMTMSATAITCAPSIVSSTALTMCSGWGMALCSSRFEYGIGTSAPVTRWIGASR